jgi:hypothetical protein
VYHTNYAIYYVTVLVDMVKPKDINIFASIAWFLNCYKKLAIYEVIPLAFTLFGSSLQVLCGRA